MHRIPVPIGDFKIMHEKNSRMRPTKLSPPSEGPYQVLVVCENTAKIQYGGYREDIYLTRIAPYFKREDKESESYLFVIFQSFLKRV